MTSAENKVHLINCLDGLRQLPEKCAGLIICDPPYFRVKGDFDFRMTWKEWLNLHRHLARECKRVLADNGTLFLWGYSKYIAYQQIIFDRLLELENSLVWRKIDSMQYQYYSPDQARRFNTHNERLLMYSKGNSLGEWIKSKRTAANLTRNEVDVAMGFVRTKNPERGTELCRRWEEGSSEVKEVDFIKLCKVLGANGQYLDLSRPFNNFAKIEEVLEFSQEGHKTKAYDHETVKPEKLTRALILTCSRKNDLVVVPFAGSGTECAMAAKEGRRFIGFEIEQKYVDMSNERARVHLEQKQISLLDFIDP